MVLDVFVEGCDDSFGCQYSGFGKFRCEIIRGWNEELGKLYEKKYRFLWDRNTSFFIPIMFMASKSKELDGEMAKILDEYDKPYNEGMRLFAFHSDCDGEINPEECVLLLKSFGRIDPEKFVKSEDNEFLRESYDIWLEMLTFAIENNESIIFG